MYQEVKKHNINDFLEGKIKLFEQDHRIKYDCLYKIHGKKHHAKICFETGEIFIKGQVVRRCQI